MTKHDDGGDGSHYGLEPSEDRGLFGYLADLPGAEDSHLYDFLGHFRNFEHLTRGHNDGAGAGSDAAADAENRAQAQAQSAEEDRQLDQAAADRAQYRAEHPTFVDRLQAAIPQSVRTGAQQAWDAAGQADKGTAETMVASKNPVVHGAGLGARAINRVLNR
jgi:hypothetical protein